MGVRAALWETPFSFVRETPAQDADEAARLINSTSHATPRESGPATALLTRERSAGRDRKFVFALAPVAPYHAGIAAPPLPRHLYITPGAAQTTAKAPDRDTPVPAIVALPPPFMRPPATRLHLAAWSSWRQGSGLPILATGARPAGYGGTQMGFVGQFDLMTEPRRPAVHVRATYAPDRPRQREAAVGIGVRPLADVPIRVLAEVRATDSQGSTQIRPAAFAVTELAATPLPLGLSAEGYAQGGWVGGRFATAFADGQLRVMRPIARGGGVRASIGVGAWGGAQKFAERLDVGPSATIDLAPVRLSLDYRVRVAGNATPGNGAALTLSTGF
ncbi:hypothetical protein [Altererythrobacter sp. TH136]|uniref:hypothetical protein n=1 Tax=Altererythrobacter sp. TH136 TaxID=2067415 RepID=UPI001163E020|nr:hypothetical protein [Altererythrobacter sp. TH136]QDM41555.1 hypothetical protein C0V74_11300 [Altererythrobacter sp. TH136]